VDKYSVCSIANSSLSTTVSPKRLLLNQSIESLKHCCTVHRTK